jgi:WD40 repeat protein
VRALPLLRETMAECVVEIILHNVATREIVSRLSGAHKGKVSGLCWTGDRLLSCGVDRTVKLWDSTRTSDPLDDTAPGPSTVCSALHIIRRPLMPSRLINR